MDSVEDLFGVLMGAMRGKEKEEEKRAAGEELCKEGGQVRYWFGKFLNRIEEREKAGVKSGLFIGEDITIAELKFGTAISGLKTRASAIKDSPLLKLLEEEKYKPLLKIVDVVTSNEKVKAFTEQFVKNMEAHKEKPENNTFKYAGKYVCE